MASVSIEEQETHISMSRDCSIAKVYTSDRTIMTAIRHKMEDRGSGSEWRVVREIRDSDGDIVGMQYECPVKCISFRSGTLHREMTEEQRIKAANRLREARAKKEYGGDKD